MPHDKKEKEKRTYEKPTLRTIELAAEEVLTVGCKTTFVDPKGVAGNGCLSGVCSRRIGS
jgi:hypothetical protein